MFLFSCTTAHTQHKNGAECHRVASFRAFYILFRPKSFTSKYCLSKYKVIHYILHQLPDINLDDDLICDNFFQNGEEYFERFPKFMKYNDYVVPCKETYACAFI